MSYRSKDNDIRDSFGNASVSLQDAPGAPETEKTSYPTASSSEWLKAPPEASERHIDRFVDVFEYPILSPGNKPTKVMHPKLVDEEKRIYSEILEDKFCRLCGTNIEKLVVHKITNKWFEFGDIVKKEIIGWRCSQCKLVYDLTGE